MSNKTSATNESVKSNTELKNLYNLDNSRTNFRVDN